MNTAIEKATSTYKTIRTVVNVRVKIPRKGTQMKRVEAHTFESANGSISVPLHWRNGILLQDAGEVIVTRHFFAKDELLGEEICARVEVVEKTTGDGRKFILLNIYPLDKDLDEASWNLKFKKGETDQGVNIPGTEHEVRFNPIV